MKAKEPFKEFMDSQKPVRIVAQPRPIDSASAWVWDVRMQCYRNEITGECREDMPACLK